MTSTDPHIILLAYHLIIALVIWKFYILFLFLIWFALFKFDGIIHTNIDYKNTNDVYIRLQFKTTRYPKMVGQISDLNITLLVFTD